MCVYSDYQGWNNKQFTGRGEFALVFGNFDVSMKVPADHVVASTGTCQNVSEVLTPEQFNRWKQAQKANNPIEVVTLEEAKQREKNPDKNTQYNQNRRARIVASGGSISSAEWHMVKNTYGNKCLRCGRSDVKLTMDHVIPLSVGGSHTIENIQPLCSSCNSWKNTKTIDYRK